MSTHGRHFLPMTVYYFISQNLLAMYAAAVGSIALALNFIRYRHAVSSAKPRLKLEVVAEKNGRCL